MQKHISDEGLVIEIYKGLLKFNNNKTTQFKIHDRQLFKEYTDVVKKPMKKRSALYVIKGIANKNSTDVTMSLLKWLKYKILITRPAEEDREPQEFSCIASGNAKCYGCFGRQFRDFSHNLTQAYHIFWTSILPVITQMY